MPGDHLEQFEGKAWKTGNSLVVTLPEWLVKKHDLSEGERFEVSINRPSFMIYLSPSARATHSMRLTYDLYRRFGDYFPKSPERFLVEVDGESRRHYLTHALTISGFGPFYEQHPKLTRVRWQVLKPKTAFRIEYDESWTD